MLKQSLQQKLQQKLSPQQIQLMKLIQLPTLEFEQKLKSEIEENPALDEGKEGAENEELDFSKDEEFNQEEDQFIESVEINVDEYLSDDETPSYRLHANNYSADDEEKQIPYATGTSFTEFLKNQLNLKKVSPEQYAISEFLIGSINENGYLRRELEHIIDDLAFSSNIFVEIEQLEQALQLIQSFDPSGVGARDLKECLIIQLKRKKESESVNLAISILDRYFESFTKKHYSKICSRLSISEEELKKAIKEISKLNPKPGNSISQSGDKNIQQIIPDFEIRIIEGELELLLNGRNAPDLKISKSYVNMLQSYKETKGQANKAQKEAVLFVKQKLDSAKWFIDAIKQRQNTLLVTMNSIMKYQKEYFLTGDERKLKPMILKDIADDILMDISTVSRVANSKFVQTPYGTKLIKEFFSESMKNDQGEDVSTREIKNILQELITKEEKRKPLTDETLAKQLKEKGYPIARRTVAKYREQLNIPVARLRKQI